MLLRGVEQRRLAIHTGLVHVCSKSRGLFVCRAATLSGPSFLMPPWQPGIGISSSIKQELDTCVAPHRCVGQCAYYLHINDLCVSAVSGQSHDGTAIVASSRPRQSRATYGVLYADFFGLEMEVASKSLLARLKTIRRVLVHLESLIKSSRYSLSVAMARRASTAGSKRLPSDEKCHALMRGL